MWWARVGGGSGAVLNTLKVTTLKVTIVSISLETVLDLVVALVSSSHWF